MTDRATRDRLCEQYFPLVQTLAKRAKLRLPPSIELDDLVGIGAFALLERATHYEPERGVPFDAYARTRIYGAMISAYRWRHWRNATMDGLESVSPETAMRQFTVRPDHDERIDAARKQRALAEVVEILPARERSIVKQYYGRGRTNRQVGQVIGLGENRVGQIHRGALVTMKRALSARRIDRAA